ncbi:diguanylate cyclase [Comamonas sp. J-3]|uniref:GGDEF domain-containing protein n=1 Tax=Comamonas trifloxystrobinivorans TaxID=3350256 RepID=UPI00372CACB3
MLLASTATSTSQSHSGRLLALACLGIFVACMMGILLRPIGYLSVFWPANQLLLVLILRYPRVLLQPLSLLAIFASFVLADLITGSALWVSVGFTLANMAGAAVAWLILHKQSERDLQMEGQYSGLLVFYGSGVASIVSALLGGTISVYAFNIPLVKGLVMWWTGEWMNAMIILPFLLALPTVRKTALPHDRAQGLALVLPVVAVVLLEAASYTVGSKVGSLVFSLPALIWCALTYRIITTTMITMLVFATKVIAASAGSMDFTPAHYVDVATLRLGITMLILGPLSVAGAHAARSELLHRMRYQAHHDSLTDVLSRNGFVQASNSLLQRLTHESGSVAVLMLDLDHFKRVNDSYGHATGDLLLREFTRTMTQTLRPQDVLGRIGGEEFAVVLPRISAADAATIAERLCHAVRSGNFQTTQNEPLRATVSIGVAYITQLASQDSIENLLRDADVALYQAKAGGRDRVVLSPVR